MIFLKIEEMHLLQISTDFSDFMACTKCIRAELFALSCHGFWYLHSQDTLKLFSARLKLVFADSITAKIIYG
jgi:hypothetical protein